MSSSYERINSNFKEIEKTGKEIDKGLAEIDGLLNDLSQDQSRDSEIMKMIDKNSKDLDDLLKAFK